MAKDNKKIMYFIGTILVIAYLLNQTLTGSESAWPEILPDANNCINVSKEVSYTTMNTLGNITPIEYCKPEDFCNVFEVQVIDEYGRYDDSIFNNVALSNLDKICFIQDAGHTQRNVMGEVQARFICCN